MRSAVLIRLFSRRVSSLERRHARRRIGAEAMSAPAAPAHQLDPDHDRDDRRKVDMVVSGPHRLATAGDGTAPQ
jgi:hypothetical protein